MSNVAISPIAFKFRNTPDWLLPCPPPVFTNGRPSPDEIAVARALIDALDERSRAWYVRFLGPAIGRAEEPVWTTAMPDWEQCLIEGRSIIQPPIFDRMAQEALAIFKRLRITDLPGQPTFGECCEPFVFEFVLAVFGGYDGEIGKQLIRESFLLIAKKNTKSTVAAGMMLVATILCWRNEEEHLILAPTKEVADNSFKPAAAMVRADDDLQALFHVQDHVRTITQRITNAPLKVLAADTDTVSGKKSGKILIDEFWLFGKRVNADSMLMEATGGLVSRPEGWIIKLTTQSDEPPAGVFKEGLTYYRNVRDGKVVDPRKLPILYEFPEAMVKSGAYADSKNWYITNPNLGRSVTIDALTDLRKEYEAKTAGFQKFLAKHLNVEIGLNLRTDRWAGADFWQRNADPTLTLDSLLERSEVVTAGIDGGGLDDLLGLAVIGREKVTRRWLLWCHAWAHKIVLDRRKEIASMLADFTNDGDLTFVESPGDDVQEVADIICRINDCGLFPEEQAIGVDAAGIGDVVDELVTDHRGIKLVQISAISQGWKLNGAIKTTERSLAGGQISHTGSRLMNWCVGNARIVAVGNAVTINKQVSGSAKIDPLMGVFDAVSLMNLNPEASGGNSFWEVKRA